MKVFLIYSRQESQGRIEANLAQNILIAHPGPEWHIKLSDFGISALDIREEYDRDKLASIKVYDHDDPRPCSDGEVPNAAGLKKNQDWSAGLKTFIGTPEYMAPEIHRMRWNGGAYGREADLWSVGVLAYRMLTGSRLPLDFVMACRYWESGAPPALKFPANIGTGARLFIRNLLHPDPAQRPLACEFLDAFWLRYDSAPAPIARGVGHHESEGKGSPTLSTARRTSTASLDVLLLPDTERLQGVNASLRGTMHRLMDSEAVSEMERERTEANRRLNWLKSELDLKWEGVDIGRLCDLIMSDNPLDEHQGWVDQVRRLRTRIAKKLERGEGDDHERLSADATAVEKALHVNQAAFERNAEIVIRPREPLVEVQNAGLGLHGQSPQLMSLMTDQWQQYDLTAGSDYEATVYKEWTE